MLYKTLSIHNQILFYIAYLKSTSAQYLELFPVHGSDFGFFANGEGVGDRLVWGFGGDDEVVASLLDLSYRFDVFGHFDDILRES